jgi:hypothetical protein
MAFILVYIINKILQRDHYCPLINNLMIPRRKQKGASSSFQSVQRASSPLFFHVPHRHYSETFFESERVDDS